MTIRYFIAAVVIALAACAGKNAADSQFAEQELCAVVEKQRAAFRQEMARKARELEAEQKIAGSKAESYPKLKDAEKFLNFQTELKGGENQFILRLRRCSRG